MSSYRGGRGGWGDGEDERGRGSTAEGATSVERDPKNQRECPDKSIVLISVLIHCPDRTYFKHRYLVSRQIQNLKLLKMIHS